jgi:hypothetical protein
MELNQVLKRVRQFTAKAEAPIAEGATPAERQAAEIEQQTARAMADKLMEEYSVTEAQAEATRPIAQRQRPGKIEVSLAPPSDVSGYISTLANMVASHCRCMIRLYSRYDHVERMWMAKIYGFESDVRYFEILYTTLRLHMIGAIMPKPDPHKSLEDNAYILHNAGLNWIGIAEEYGWYQVERKPGDTSKAMYENNQFPGERRTFARAVAIHEAAYKRACEARGEKTMRIPPGGAKTFRLSAAQGYIDRLNTRLRAVREGRLPGAEVILRSRVDDLRLFFRRDNPDLFQTSAETDAEPVKVRRGRVAAYKPPPFSQAGYTAGVSHADTATLNPGSALKSTKEIS